MKNNGNKKNNNNNEIAAGGCILHLMGQKKLNADVHVRLENNDNKRKTGNEREI